MTTYIVKDKDGREVWRGTREGGRDAMTTAYWSIKPEVADLMLAAGYTVDEAVEMIEVPVRDLETALVGLDCPVYRPVKDRLRALVEKHRSGK